jgi:dephospho-CoA kinase
MRAGKLDKTGGAVATTSDQVGAQALAPLERQSKVKILGLTGSIGMGKSEAARALKRLGVPVFEADKIVHQLLAKDAIPFITETFPACIKNGVVDREALGKIVFADMKQKALLEAIMHPLVRAKQKQFLQAMLHKQLVVLDIPLLFETGWDKECDAVMVVSAPHMIQRQRVMRRAGMTEQKFHAILATQMPDSEKRKRADFIIHTGLGKRFALCEIAQALYDTRNRTRY